MIDPTPLTFAQPEWFWLCLLLAPLLGLRLLTRAGGRRTLELWVSRRLQKSLVWSGSPVRGWMIFLLQGIGLVFLIAALARPLMGEKKVESEAEGRNVILAIDVSRSMLAEDVEPNRLERAKLACEDLVAGLFGERVGVVAFAGRAFLQAPLTEDHEAVQETLRQLDTFTIARGGTNLAEAINLASETFRKAGAASNGLVIFSDGDELEGEALEVARNVAEEGVHIVTVGIGTDFGAIIPNPEARQRGGEPFVKDEQGNVVKSRLMGDALRAIAQAGGGFFVSLGSEGLPIDRILAVLEDLESQAYEGSAGRTVAVERYAVPLSAGICLFILGELLGLARSRRRRGGAGFVQVRGSSRGAARTVSGAAVTAGLWLCLLSDWSSGAAAAADDPVLESYRAEDFQVAKEGYEKRLAEGWRRFQGSELQLGRGAAAYRLGDYEVAAEAFGEALKSEDSGAQLRAHYNLGNALARQGMLAEGDNERQEELWRTAIEHYSSALSLEPSHSEAAYNRSLVEKRLDAIKPPEQEEQEDKKEESGEQQQQKKNQQQEGDSEQEQDSESETEKQEQDSDESGEQQQDEQQEQSGQQEGEATEEGDEQQAAGKEGDQQQEQEQGGQDQSAQEGGNEEREQSAGGDQDRQEDSGEGESPEGELGTAEGSEGKEGNKGRQQAAGVDDVENPETGFSPSRARALLRAFADEDMSIRPEQRKSTNENYKNW